MKSRFKRLFIIGLIVLVLCIVFPLPVPINKTLTGVEVGTENSEVIEDKVIIKGTYYRYLFRDNSFHGRIQIESRDPSGKLQLLKFNLSQNEYLKGKVGQLSYYSGEQNKILFSGTILVKGNFKDIMIWYPSQEEERFFLSAGLEYQEAMECVRDWTKGAFGF